MADRGSWMDSVSGEDVQQTRLFNTRHRQFSNRLLEVPLKVRCEKEEQLERDGLGELVVQQNLDEPM